VRRPLLDKVKPIPDSKPENCEKPRPSTPGSFCFTSWAGKTPHVTALTLVGPVLGCVSPFALTAM